MLKVKETFDDVIKEKVNDLLEIKKLEIAENLFTDPDPEEEDVSDEDNEDSAEDEEDEQEA